MIDRVGGRGFLPVGPEKVAQKGGKKRTSNHTGDVGRIVKRKRRESSLARTHYCWIEVAPEGTPRKAQSMLHGPEMENGGY